MTIKELIEELKKQPANQYTVIKWIDLDGISHAGSIMRKAMRTTNKVTVIVVEESEIQPLLK